MSDLVNSIADAFPGARIKHIAAVADEPTDQEVTAMRVASEAGGAYLEGINKYDLAALSRSEWMTMVRHIVTAFQGSMSQQHFPYAVSKSEHDPLGFPVIKDSDVPF